MTQGVGWIGQSNMSGYSEYDHVVTDIADPAELLHLLFFQIDLFNTLDNAGILTPFAFAPQHAALSSYDYPINADVPDYLPLRVFGPEIYGGRAIYRHLGADFVNIKLARPGSYLTSFPGLPQNQYTASWFNLNAHVSWDVNLPHDTEPYAKTVLEANVSTATTPTSLTRAGAGWTPNQWAYKWVVSGGKTAIIATNTTDTLNILFWTNGFTPPAPGGYEIQQRILQPSSLAKSFIQYCIGAKNAHGPGLSIDQVCIALGESDSGELARALIVKRNMLDLMWYVRQQLVANACTTLPERRVGFTLAFIKDIPFWPHAKLINQAYREIAEADPWVVNVVVQDLEVGGLFPQPSPDPIHYSGPGQQEHGKRHGAGVIDLMTRAERARASHEYFGRHKVLRPVWGVGVGGDVRRLSTLADLAGVADANRLYPGFYLRRDGGEGFLPVYLDRNGFAMSNRQEQGSTLLGYARAEAAPGTTPVHEYTPGRAVHGALYRGGKRSPLVDGFAWPMGLGSFDAFPAQQRTFSSANQSHVLHFDAGVNRIVTSIPAAGITNREWLLRGHGGIRALTAQLQIDEKVGTQAVNWMRHRLGWGDHTTAQTAGIGRTKMPTILSAEATSQRIACKVLAQEYGADDQTPVGSRDIWDVNHGGADALGEGVHWPDVVLTQEVEPNYRGIEGCFRVVHQFAIPFAIGDTGDTIELRLNCFAMPTFGRQVAYDPATDTTTDGSWDPGTNRYHEITSTTRTTFNPNGTIASSGASWFSQDAGFVGWESNGAHGSPADGLTMGLYNRIAAVSWLDRPTMMILGNRASPTPPNYPAFAAYDQLDWCYCQQLLAAQPKVFAANHRIRVATFLLVGTLAQVKLAAQALYTLGADATWTD